MLTKEISDLIKGGALVVCNHSAGKDSQAMFQYLKGIVPREQLVVVHAHLPSVEWEGVIEHIMKTIDGYDYYQVQSEMTLLGMVESRGMWPSAQFRKCTSKLKMDPIDKKIRQLCKERNVSTVINCMGIRAQESHNRAKKLPFKKNDRLSIKGRTVFEWFPIFEKKIDWVWATIAGAFQQPHWAYGVGMSRLSCMFCILGNKADHKISAKYNPEHLNTIDALERKIGHTIIQPAKGKAPVFLKDHINS